MVAYHSLLVFNVLGVSGFGDERIPTVAKPTTWSSRSSISSTRITTCRRETRSRASTTRSRPWTWRSTCSRAAQPHCPRRRAQEHQGQPRRGAGPRGPPARRRGVLPAARHWQHARHLPARRRPDAVAAAADATRQLRRHLGRARALPARPDGSGLSHQLRTPQEQQAGDRAHSPRARGAARGDSGADVRADRLPGADPRCRPEGRWLLARPGRPAAQGDGQEEEGDPRRRVRPVLRGYEGQRLLRRGDQGPLGDPRPVLRLRLQQGAHRVVRPDLLLDCLPQRSTTRPSTWRRC